MQDNNTTSETEKLWQDFTNSGSIYSYLRYKDAIKRSDSTFGNKPDISSKLRDGEPIGYR